MESSNHSPPGKSKPLFISSSNPYSADQKEFESPLLKRALIPHLKLKK